MIKFFLTNNLIVLIGLIGLAWYLSRLHQRQNNIAAITYELYVRQFPDQDIYDLGKRLDTYPRVFVS